MHAADCVAADADGAAADHQLNVGAADNGTDVAVSPDADTACGVADGDDAVGGRPADASDDADADLFLVDAAADAADADVDIAQSCCVATPADDDVDDATKCLM